MIAVAERDVARAYEVQGRRIELPVVVRHAVSMSAMYVVRTAAVRALMGHPGLHVVELLPGRAVCILAAIEYLDNDLGRYNEFSIAFFAGAGARAPVPLAGLIVGLARHTVGAYIHRLPVTTEFSRDAGRDIWGFPKTVDQIDFVDAGTTRACRWVADGRHVLTFRARRGGSRRVPEMPQDAYAVRDGVLWKTPSAMGGEEVGMRLGGAQVELGEHPIAAELCRLGFPKRALASTWMGRMHARFEAPIRIG